MFIHSVYFWLRPDLTGDEHATFVAGLESLRGIEHVHSGYIGRPAPTDRSVIDRSYSYALILLFPNAGAEQGYQVHPVHDHFRASCGGFWTQVRIYDAVE
jgi:Stress responsive A/B Barrel Domain